MAASSTTPEKASRLLRLNVEKSSLDNNEDLQTNGIELPEYAYMQRLDEIAARAHQKFSDGQAFTSNLSDFPSVDFAISQAPFRPVAEMRMNLDDDTSDLSYNVQYVAYLLEERKCFTSVDLVREKLVIKGYHDVILNVAMGNDDSMIPLVFVCPLISTANIGLVTVASLILRFSRFRENDVNYYEISWLGVIFDESLSKQPHHTTMIEKSEHVRNMAKGQRTISVIDALTQRATLLPYNAEQLAVFVSMKIKEIEERRRYRIDQFPVVSIERTNVPVRMHVKKPYVVYTLRRKNMVRELDVQESITVQYYPEDKPVKILMTTKLSGIPRYASVGKFVGCLHYTSGAATYILVELTRRKQLVKVLTFNAYLDIDYTVPYE